MTAPAASRPPGQEEHVFQPATRRERRMAEDFMAYLESPVIEEHGPFPVPPHPAQAFTTVWLLSFFLGFLGADRFYTGKYVTGTLKLLTLGGAGIWWLTDVIIIVLGHGTGRKGHALTNPPRMKLAALNVTVAIIAAALGFSVPPLVGAVSDHLRTTATQHEPTWHETLSLSDSGTIQSSPFTLAGGQQQVTYTLTSGESGGSIYLLAAGESLVPGTTVPAAVIGDGGSAEQVIEKPAGEYVMVVDAPGAEWKATLSELR